MCIFILSHGRPDNVLTYKTLKKKGCTYPIYIIIDNEDKTADRYYEIFGKDKVVMFDKLKESKTFDTADNFDDRRTIVYARNASFDIAKKLGFKYFLQLDDDYVKFDFKINKNEQYPADHWIVKNKIDNIFKYTLDFYKSIKAQSIAFSQGGDWFGGVREFGKFKRKAMNSFFCSIDRPFKFVGRINEDVNTYTSYQSKGNLFFTIPFISVGQMQTQTNGGGMTDVYLDGGTYLKSFYTVIFAPSCTTVTMMGTNNRRLHHRINWNNAVPKILPEYLRKKSNKDAPNGGADGLPF